MNSFDVFVIKGFTVVDKDPVNIPPTANPASPGIYNRQFMIKKSV